MYFEALASGGDDWYNIVLITAPEGASITFDDGDEEVIVTGTGMQYPVPLHNDSSTYSITVDANGFVKTDSVTTGAVSGQVFTKIIKYAKITLTYDDAFRGQNFNITDGSISPSTQQAFPSTGNTIDLYVPNTGTWKTSSSAAGESYESKGATVVDLDSSYVDELHTRPDGKTATPTDIIQTWLECAGIRNKDYTTLEEVLADKETLQTLISDENAVDYMVRSKSWIGGKESLVPQMTSETLPEGLTFSSGNYNANHPSWKAFVESYTGITSQAWMASTTADAFVGYKFTSPKIIDIVEFQNATIDSGSIIRIKDYIIQASNDTTDGTDGTWVDLYSGTYAKTQHVESVNINNNNAYIAYRIYFTTGYGYYIAAYDIKFKRFGITDDPTAMRYIGLRNYAADTLLDDEDWCEAICNSAYFESVLNAKVPAMTDDTHPSGVVTASNEHSDYPKYKAFDGNIDVAISSSNHGWWNAGGSHIIGDYIRYEFVNPILVKKALIKYNNNQQASLKLQGSPNLIDWIDLTDELTLSGSNTSQDLWLILDNSDEFKYYQMIFTKAETTGGHGYKLQFYGREDVDESVIHIYSAASDNDIHYLNGSTPVNVAHTDPDGHGTIARTLLPAGTYDLYSSVAMDPDGDLSTEYFHKEVTVKADTIEIMLMPDNTIYWYGYKGEGFSNPVRVPGQNPGAVTETTNYLVLNSSIKSFGKDNIPNADIATAKGLVNSITATNQAMIGMAPSADTGGVGVTSTLLSQSGLHVISVDKDTSVVGDVRTYFFVGNDHGNHNVYALWYE